MRMYNMFVVKLFMIERHFKLFVVQYENCHDSLGSYMTNLTTEKAKARGLQFHRQPAHFNDTALNSGNIAQW